jgi:lactate dehydrogenase-like 2-hydroxyacid dehydrogenase
MAERNWIEVAFGKPELSKLANQLFTVGLRQAAAFADDRTRAADWLDSAHESSHDPRMDITVGVTEPEYRKAEDIFSRALEEGCQCVPVPAEEQPMAVALRHESIQHVIVGVASYRGPLYETLRPGSVIARFGVGHDGVDKGKASAQGILCTNTPGVLDDSVAEHAMGLILALARHTLFQADRLIAGDWSPRIGVELAGKKLAVIGCGGIGRRVARIAARGFGMKVTGLRKTQSQADEMLKQFGFDEVVTDFAQAAAHAEFVSLHLPGGPETHHYLNRGRIHQLQSGCYLINTARGAVLDESALFEALTNGRVAGAALDVFEQEPYQPQAPDRDLRQLPNVVLTPHTGSSTREACDRMAKRALYNIQLAAAGRYREMDLLNPAVLALGTRVPTRDAQASV